MIEKYFSELLNKTFDTKEECLKAEKEFEEKHKAELQLKEERAADAKKVEEAFAKYNEAGKEARELLSEFCKKYGAYHKTFSNITPATRSLFDIFFDI